MEKAGNVNIPTPSPEQVDHYIHEWESRENYVYQEKALDKIFFELCPENKNINDILIKTATLNDFYSTNIYSVYSVAKHIETINNIDVRIKEGDETLIEEIQNVTINGKCKRFYSFATKYCSHHNPLAFPIYDNYVAYILYIFRKQDNFFKFTKSSLKNYGVFKNTINAFMDFYGLTQYSVKDIDKYLWSLGKDIIGRSSN